MLHRIKGVKSLKWFDSSEKSPKTTFKQFFMFKSIKKQIFLGLITYGNIYEKIQKNRPRNLSVFQRCFTGFFRKKLFLFGWKSQIPEI